MVTKEQAIELGSWNGGEVHYTGQHDCKKIVGPRGGVTVSVTRVRPSGKCKVWKTRPSDFRLPVKYGMYESAEITQNNAADWHLASECPLLHSEE